MFNIKAVIFDMDGTIFDTEEVYLNIIKSLMHKYGVEPTEADLLSLVGKSAGVVIDFIKNVTGFKNVSAITKDFASEYIIQVETNGAKLKTGMQNLLEYLKQNDYRIAIATSASRELLELNFNNSPLSLADFEFALTLDDVQKTKPDKEVYEKACSKLGLSSRECLVIEDSCVGATAGLNANCIVALVPDKEQPTPEIESRLELKFNNLNEVLNFLETNKR